MKKQHPILRKAALFALAAVACFFLSWSPLETELHLTPEWTIDINKAAEAQNTEAKIPFRLSNKGGYFTHSGKITSIHSIPYKAVFTRDYYALYSRNAKNIPLFLPDGGEQCVIKGAGFPFVQEDRVFLFEPGGSSLAFVNVVDGGIASRYENTAPITAFNSSKNGSVAGYADGQLIIFDKNGKKRVEVFPGGSDNPIILGADINGSGKSFACVCGLNPQRFVLYRDEGTYEKIIFHDFLKDEMTRQTYVHFSENGKYVYYDASGSLGIIDINKLEQTKIDVAGKILNIQECKVANSLYVLSRADENKYTVTILQDSTQKAGEFCFEADSAFILADTNTLYIGQNDKISKIAISKN